MCAVRSSSLVRHMPAGPGSAAGSWLRPQVMQTLPCMSNFPKQFKSAFEEGGLGLYGAIAVPQPSEGKAVRGAQDQLLVNHAPRLRRECGTGNMFEAISCRQSGSSSIARLQHRHQQLAVDGRERWNRWHVAFACHLTSERQRRLQYAATIRGFACRSLDTCASSGRASVWRWQHGAPRHPGSDRGVFSEHLQKRRYSVKGKPILTQKPETVPQHRINNQIGALEVRLVHENGSHDVMSLKAALREAQNAGLDLVELVAEAKPPVCRLLDYKAYQHEHMMKQRVDMLKAEQRQKQEAREAKRKKEMRFSPRISSNDYNLKMSKVRDFIARGMRTTLTMLYAGPREQQIAYDRMKQIVEELTALPGVVRIDLDKQATTRRKLVANVLLSGHVRGPVVPMPWDTDAEPPKL